MTTIEYFAAHAPADIPAWFEPKLTERPVQVKSPFDMFYYHENKEWREYYRSYVECDIDLLPAGAPQEMIDAISAQSAANVEYEAAIAKWERNKQMDTYFQWRVYYALQMDKVTKHSDATLKNFFNIK